MDPNRKITKKFTQKFDSKVINRQYFHKKTGLQNISNVLLNYCSFFSCRPLLGIPICQFEFCVHTDTEICCKLLKSAIYWSESGQLDMFKQNVNCPQHYSTDNLKFLSFGKTGTVQGTVQNGPYTSLNQFSKRKQQELNAYYPIGQ